MEPAPTPAVGPNERRIAVLLTKTTQLNFNVSSKSPPNDEPGRGAHLILDRECSYRGIWRICKIFSTIGGTPRLRTQELPLSVPTQWTYFAQLLVTSKPSLGSSHAAARTSLFWAFEADGMIPYCAALQPANSCPTNNAALSSIQAKNTAKLVELYVAFAAAETMEGETGISNALKALKKSPGVGSKIDIVLTLIVCIGFFLGDYLLVQEHLDLTDALVQEGGDWERLNCLCTVASTCRALR
ncbi:hypothetical protein FISHEDRAFT_72073 [Fistulina hepatica ATCC 64428]|uniref:26S proteasome regulatory subunit Rpn7 N-terminal domain-containing protein n=1 Tax=Fistulina hepatica ATCC 64428 TaxID=1128425 RepID=A0A0D7AI68_9AGAR|nr:hypothetical protein FISHEDRAFT_72073 [Fistulina hepatica ATCC 64428]